MTREENLHWIDQEIQTWENECQSKHPIKEALYAARRALEQDPTTKNDLGVDAISRQAVIDELKRYFHDEYYQRTSIQDCRDCFIEDVLNHLPSVAPQETTLILDKIRAEIKAMSGDIETIADVLAIIDKYKAESEET